jgi:hypothetical protein
VQTISKLHVCVDTKKCVINYNCQWAQEDVETFYNLLNNNNSYDSTLLNKSTQYEKNKQVLALCVIRRQPRTDWQEDNKMASVHPQFKIYPLWHEHADS